MIIKHHFKYIILDSKGCVLQMIADVIKNLRDQRGMSQSELAKRLSITRSSVCAWEQGLSCPTAQYIIELAKLFRVCLGFYTVFLFLTVVSEVFYVVTTYCVYY